MINQQPNVIRSDVDVEFKIESMTVGADRQLIGGSVGNAERSVFERSACHHLVCDIGKSKDLL